MNIIDVAKLKLIEDGGVFITKNPYLTTNLEDLNVKIFEFLEKLDPDKIYTSITCYQSMLLILSKGLYKVYIDLYISERNGNDGPVMIYKDNEIVLSDYGGHEFIFEKVIDFISNIS